MAEKQGKGATADDARTTLEWDLDQLYERHHRQVFHLALRYGRGNPSFAEDVMHDVFVKLCRARERLSEPALLSAWLYRVTTNLCLNKLRHEALVSSAPVRWLLGERPDERTPESALLARDELTRAFEAVNALPIKERAVFFMCHVDGKEQTEVARVLGHSKGYVSKLLKRAETRLSLLGWEVSA
jgi:RNA polymerase sigma-70 factor (ECF subfamily)